MSYSTDRLEVDVYEAQDDKERAIAMVKPDPSHKAMNLKWVLTIVFSSMEVFLQKRRINTVLLDIVYRKFWIENLRNISIPSGLKMAPGGDAFVRRVKQLVFTPIHDWLDYSKRVVVEVHVSPNRKKNAIKNEEVGKISELCLHLWLDAIAKALPRGSQITVEPQTNGCECCWVMSKSGYECKKLSHTFENKKVLEKEKQKLLKDQTEKGQREMKLT
ncbi:hypothetical protein BTUL_0261g00140 [Botrytis tulipae]|uniref:Uncharacterized protein n=1 Tax=Botrytis tulipae TaxID=87230 RepID=A0A4Z1EE52_9HELO|nr:hypothetical protein BTUL_0261g00140 [Botrytis tulipae]